MGPMKNIVHALLVIPIFLLLLNCSTTGKFKIPAGTKLQVTDRMVTPDENGEWTTSPFFWSKASGADFRLFDADGKVVRTGKLKMKFRVASIFWPPGALIYWPMGLVNELYDLTRPSDGRLVRDNPVAVNYGDAPQAAEATTEPAPTPAPAKKAPKKNK